MLSTVSHAYEMFTLAILNMLRSDKAQDTFEYLLIIGGVTVAVILAIVAAAPGLLTPVITGVCNAVDTAVPGPAFVC